MEQIEAPRQVLPGVDDRQVSGDREDHLPVDRGLPPSAGLPVVLDLADEAVRRKLVGAKRDDRIDPRRRRACGGDRGETEQDRDADVGRGIDRRHAEQLRAEPP